MNTMDLKKQQPELSETTACALGSSASRAIRSVLIFLLTELSELDRPVCSVLDCFHEVSSKTIHQELEFLLTHAPPHFHLLLAPRSDPHINLARLRANGDIEEIRASDLRFRASSKVLDRVFDDTTSTWPGRPTSRTPAAGKTGCI